MANIVNGGDYMRIKVKYHLFNNIDGKLIPGEDRYEIIDIDDEVNMDSYDGNEAVKVEISRVIRKPTSEIKVLNGTLM